MFSYSLDALSEALLLSTHNIHFCRDLIVLGFNDTSTLMGHFVSSPREREKRDSRRDEREGQGRKRSRNESEETEEIKTFPLYPYLLQGQQAMPNCKPISVGPPGNVRYTTPSHHPTTPNFFFFFFFFFFLSRNKKKYQYNALNFQPRINLKWG